MNKTIIISSTILGVIIIATISWAFLLKGTLDVNVLPVPATVFIDNKEYDDVSKLSLKVQTGTHKIVVKKDFYQDYSDSISVPLWQTKNLDVALMPSQDAKTITSVATKVTYAWIIFTSNKNSDDFLQTVKPYLESDVYDSTSININSASHPSRPDITTVLPEISGPIQAINLTRINSASVQANVLVTKKNNDQSVSSLVYDFVKTGNQWIIQDINYNY